MESSGQGKLVEIYLARAKVLVRPPGTGYGPVYVVATKHMMETRIEICKTESRSIKSQFIPCTVVVV